MDRKTKSKLFGKGLRIALYSGWVRRCQVACCYTTATGDFSV